MRRHALLLLATLVAAPAAAQERELCADRPGLGAPPCIVDRGRVLVETAVADWTRDDGDGVREEQLLIGDTLVRVGVTDTIEVQLGWTPFGHGYLRDRTGGTVERSNRVGDVLVGAKLNLARPDGGGFSIALQPVVTLPVGREPISAGDWSAGIAAPIAYDLSDTISLEATPQLAAEVDADGHGRHLVYGSVVGLGVALGEKGSVSVEYQGLRDEDPAGHSTQHFAALAFAWQPGDDLQFDIGGAAGLDRDAPDARLYAGIARRF